MNTLIINIAMRITCILIPHLLSYQETNLMKVLLKAIPAFTSNKLDLQLAKDELTTRGEENQNFLEELDKNVALLAFEDITNYPLGDPLNVSQCLKTVSLSPGIGTKK